MVTQEHLKEILDYNPDTGVFVWKQKTAPSQHNIVGKVAGNQHKLTGYIQIGINKKIYLAHRLVLLYMYGKLPNNQVDHINHNRTDNRLCNLREVTHQDNLKNKSLPINNTSSVVGVYWHKRANKWCAHIKLNGKHKYLGSFITIAEAAAAREAANKQYNFHNNHGL